MVSTRRAPPEQPARGEAQSDIIPKETKPAAIAPTSPSRKRHAEGEDGGRAEKRRQLTPNRTQTSQAYADTKQENHKNGGNKVEEQIEPAQLPEARGQLQDTARELLKLYACTKSFEYLSAILSRSSSRKGKLYKALYEKFQRQRLSFPTKDNFISPNSIDSSVESQRFARCINFVTFASSMLGSRDASFSQLNDHFFEVFIDRTGGRTGHLLKLQADILLGLKTQAYIAQTIEKGSLQEVLLNELFPSDMTAKLQALQPDSSSARLVNSEQTFVRQITMRKRHLLKRDTPELITSMKDEYKWNDVLKNMIEYLRQHFEDIAQVPSESVHSINDDGENEEDVRNETLRKAPTPSVQPTSQSNLQTDSHSVEKSPVKAQTGLNNYVAATQATSVPLAVISTPPQESAMLDTSDDILLKAMQAANQAMEGAISQIPYSAPPSAVNGNRPLPYGIQRQSANIPGLQAQQPFSNPYSTAPPISHHQPAAFVPPPKLAQTALSINTSQSTGANQQGATLAPNGQSHPTHQLYEMAREATTGRPAQQQAPRRTGSQSQRRPWTQEEEKALLDGLDQVKGPHWSMILQLYGPGGKISEVLKDRNQVQLKDKARNLKLWFLKSGGEVPVNLRSVTGELKTRAPAAIRNAAAAAAAAQAQTSNGSHSTPSASTAAAAATAAAGNAPLIGAAQTQQQRQAQHRSFDPSNSPYAPTGPYAPTAPANTAPGMTAPMPTAGPQDTHNSTHGVTAQLSDQTADLESWGNDAADAAAAQVIKDLTSEFGFDASEFADGGMEDAVTGEATGTTPDQPKMLMGETSKETDVGASADGTITEKHDSHAKVDGSEAVAAGTSNPQATSENLASEEAPATTADMNELETIIAPASAALALDADPEKALTLPVDVNDVVDDFAAAAAAAAEAAFKSEDVPIL